MLSDQYELAPAHQIGRALSMPGGMCRRPAFGVGDGRWKRTHLTGSFKGDCTGTARGARSCSGEKAGSGSGVRLLSCLLREETIISPGPGSYSARARTRCVHLQRRTPATLAGIHLSPVAVAERVRWMVQGALTGGQQPRRFPPSGPASVTVLPAPRCWHAAVSFQSGRPRLAG